MLEEDIGNFVVAWSSYEPNSVDQIRLIWDNWWHHCREKSPGAAAGYARGHDAYFETYVKGTYDFVNGLWSPSWETEFNQGKGVYGRTISLFYTHEQANLFNGFPMTRFLRDSGRDDDIFHYEESKIISNGVVDLAKEMLAHNPHITYSNENRNGPTSYDCSSFIHKLYQEFGITVPNRTKDYLDESTYLIFDSSTENRYLNENDFNNYLVPGDVLWWGHPSGHVAIYVGEDLIGGNLVKAMIHCSPSSGKDESDHHWKDSGIQERNLVNYQNAVAGDDDGKGGKRGFTRIYRFWDNP